MYTKIESSYPVEIDSFDQGMCFWHISENLIVLWCHYSNISSTIS